MKRGVLVPPPKPSVCSGVWESGGLGDTRRPFGGGAEKGTIENEKGVSGPSPQTFLQFELLNMDVETDVCNFVT